MNLFVIICIMTTLLGPALGKVMMCYFGSWATHFPGKGNFQVSDIEPSLCTHYIYAFVGITANGDINVLNEGNDLPDRGGKNNIGKLVALKKTKTAPKVLVSMGGWNATSTNFSRVVNNTNLRTAFAKNAVAFMKNHNLDGLDLNWEYPCQRGGVEADKKGFVEFTKELKAAFVQEKLLLTATFRATVDLAARCYDILTLAKILDYINIRTYYVTTESTSNVVGHYAPMIAAFHEAPDGTLTQDSIKASIHFWLKSGVPASKLVLALPLYGRTFTLANSSLTTPGSPSAGPGLAGPYTRVLERVLSETRLQKARENKREAQDKLFDPGSLKIKPLEEYNGRKQKWKEDDISAIYLSTETLEKFGKTKNATKMGFTKDKSKFNFKCRRCRKVGHECLNCPEKCEKARIVEGVNFLVSMNVDVALSAEVAEKRKKWCLDSGCTFHLCRNRQIFDDFEKLEHKRLFVASNSSTKIKAEGAVIFKRAKESS